MVREKHHNFVLVPFVTLNCWCHNYLKSCLEPEVSRTICWPRENRKSGVSNQGNNEEHERMGGNHWVLLDPVDAMLSIDGQLTRWQLDKVSAAMFAFQVE